MLSYQIFSQPLFWSSGAMIATKRHTLLLGWGTCERSPYPPAEGPAWYSPDFFLSDPKPWRSYQYNAEINLAEAQETLASLVIPESSCLTWQRPEAEPFIQVVQQIQHLIQQGVLHKAVPYATALTATVPDVALLQRCAAGAIRQAMHYGSFCYGFWDAHEGMIGATPELLLAWEKGYLHTVACAGTATTPSLFSSKEEKEHSLVIEGLRETLAPYGIFQVGTTSVLQVGALYHLLTPVQVTLHKTALLDEIVAQVHPTPALGVYPKQAGDTWLRSYAKLHPRARFGAPIGYHLPSGEQACYVAIRQIQWNPNGIALTAGCGVTADSDPSSEWLEIQAKMQATASFLQITL